MNGVGTPAAGHIFIKDGARVAPTPGDYQAVLLAKTQVGYIDAKSGRQLVFAIFINNVPYAKFEDYRGGGRRRLDDRRGDPGGVLIAVWRARGAKRATR